jgi:hypothetical protein
LPAAKIDELSENMEPLFEAGLELSYLERIKADSIGSERRPKEGERVGECKDADAGECREEAEDDCWKRASRSVRTSSEDIIRKVEGGFRREDDVCVEGMGESTDT